MPLLLISKESINRQGEGRGGGGEGKGRERESERGGGGERGLRRQKSTCDTSDLSLFYF